MTDANDANDTHRRRVFAGRWDSGNGLVRSHFAIRCRFKEFKN